MQSKKQIQQTLDDFIEFKKIYKLTKKRSPDTIEFITDDIPDEWLITVIKYKTKSKKIMDNFIILKKQVNDKLESYQNEGWILTQN